MDNTQVKATLNGTANLAPPSSKHPKREPFTIPLVEMLFSKLDHNPLDAAVRTCLSTSFFTLTRVGEFTIPALDGFDPTIHIKHSDVSAAMDRHRLHVIIF